MAENVRCAKGNVTIQVVTETCCKCGVLFAMTEDFRTQKITDHSDFWCPNGHTQHYTDKTGEDILRERLSKVERSRDEAIACCDNLHDAVAKERARVNGYKGLARKYQKRVIGEPSDG